MENKNEKKVALNDELLDRVAGGAESFAVYQCTYCGYKMTTSTPCSRCPSCKKGEMFCIA